jgi:hypothetical protein
MENDVGTIERNIKIQELMIENQRALIQKIKLGGHAQPAPMQANQYVQPQVQVQQQVPVQN